jgi:hypothetical protein
MDMCQLRYIFLFYSSYAPIPTFQNWILDFTLHYYTVLCSFKFGCLHFDTSMLMMQSLFSPRQSRGSGEGCGTCALIQQSS